MFVTIMINIDVRKLNVSNEFSLSMLTEEMRYFL